MIGGRGGGGAGMGAAKKVAVEPHRHAGVFIARSSKDDLLLTKNLVPGDTVYNEKKVSVDVSVFCLLTIFVSVFFWLFLHFKIKMFAKNRARMARRSSTECGIRSAPSWARPSSAESTKFTSSRAPRCSTWALPAAPPSHTYQTSSDR